jgi:UDP-N-acetylmuramyl tripeptide synthase
VAVVAGKLAQRAARRFGHGGTAIPGLVAERIDARFVAHLARQLDDVILITGTNGKTTTARMIADIAQRDGRTVIHNRAGSNLMRGIGAALIDAAGPTAQLPSRSLGVFETDEATLPEAAAATQPSLLLIGNLMRDQLDRYGEIEAVRERWVSTLTKLSADTTVLLNADDPSVATLAKHAPGPVRFFGIDDTGAALSSKAAAEHALDALWDPDSGADYEFERRFYSHLGHWSCPAAGLTRPQPHIAARKISRKRIPNAPVPNVNAMTTTFQIAEGDDTQRVVLPLDGLYNVYNALAAALAARAFTIDLATIANALDELEPVFGRQEQLIVRGHPVRILLGKNPAGLNAALRTLQQRGVRHNLLVLLNDGIADGVDVSWIWDTDWESIATYTGSVTVGGDRAADMALRLHYAGLPDPTAPVGADISAALNDALDALPDGEPLVVLPTYTALLDIRERLGRMAGAPRIWDGA